MLRLSVFLSLITLLGLTMASSDGEWGFFGHRKINRLAVFTLPPPMVGFYKKHIQYLTEHAVDPDMRRHVSKYEAIKHYIDIDHWDVFPFNNIPRKRIPSIIKYAKLDLQYHDGSDQPGFFQIAEDSLYLLIDQKVQVGWQQDSFYQYFSEKFMPLYYEEIWKIPVNNDGWWPNEVENIVVTDSFSPYGILPYHLLSMQRRLTTAMKKGNTLEVIRLSADYGHYIADGHVPLHTTENYNGQLTGQDGIHAFWESRIPELFAENEYDFFVGRAEYISDLREYIWDIVLDSHVLVDSVLSVELRIRKTFPHDRQYCYSDRQGRTIRQPCEEFANAYQSGMGDMVEQRMRESIKAIGNLWYTAWIDAGQPDLAKGQKANFMQMEDSIDISKKPLGREHAG